MSARTMVEVTEEWIDQATYLGDDDMPQVNLLRILAEQVDDKHTAQLIAEYARAFRDLKKKALGGGGFDPLEELLSDK